MGDKGVVALTLGRESPVVAAERVGLGLLDAPLVEREGRIGDDEFAVILPEKNKRQAQEIAEDIRKKVEFTYSEDADPARKITISAGVSENPVDGISSNELIDKATQFLDIAKRSGRNRVVIFKER